MYYCPIVLLISLLFPHKHDLCLFEEAKRNSHSNLDKHSFLPCVCGAKNTSFVLFFPHRSGKYSKLQNLQIFSDPRFSIFFLPPLYIVNAVSNCGGIHTKSVFHHSWSKSRVSWSKFAILVPSLTFFDLAAGASSPHSTLTHPTKLP